MDPHPSIYLPVMQLPLPGQPKPVYFGTEDKRLSWGTAMDTRHDLGSYGFNLSAAEFLAVASALGVADDLEFDAGYFERPG